MGSTETDAKAKEHPIILKLSDQMVKGDRKDEARANPDLVLTWEELFMGLAELQRVFCDIHDTNANAKVWTYCYKSIAIRIPMSGVSCYSFLKHGL